MRIRLNSLLLILAALMVWLPSAAQSQRGPRTIIRGGLFQKPDSLRTKTDSIVMAGVMRDFDSLTRADYAIDSVSLYAMRTDDIRRVDSILRTTAGSVVIPGLTDSTRMAKKSHKGWFMNDSMSLSKVCWISTVLPGYEQVYNKQYWKLPLLYGALGTGVALFVNENKKFKPLKDAYNAYTDLSLNRTPELDALQTRMIRSNTKRQIYLGLTVASYIYFLGDVAVNYSTNEVSHVKKATTLATICPGAGQIYNKSYWKVPFVVGGFAAMIYCIDWNNRGFQRFKKAYALRADYEKYKDDKDKYPNGSTDEFQGRYSPEFLRNLKNNYRRNRDLCIILTAGLYVLQIVDAHVGAHLQDYDVSDDLSMNIEPLVDYTFVPTAGGNRPVFGFNLNFKF